MYCIWRRRGWIGGGGEAELSMGVTRDSQLVLLTILYTHSPQALVSSMGHSGPNFLYNVYNLEGMTHG